MDSQLIFLPLLNCWTSQSYLRKFICFLRRLYDVQRKSVQFRCLPFAGMDALHSVPSCVSCSVCSRRSIFLKQKYFAYRSNSYPDPTTPNNTHTATNLAICRARRGKRRKVISAITLKKNARKLGKKGVFWLKDRGKRPKIRLIRLLRLIKRGKLSKIRAKWFFFFFFL